MGEGSPLDHVCMFVMGDLQVGIQAAEEVGAVRNYVSPAGGAGGLAGVDLEKPSFKRENAHTIT